MSALSELLQANRRGMSARALSDRIGGRLHYATVAKYLRGQHPDNPDEATLQALADAFSLPLERVQRAADVPVGAGEYHPPAEAARLTRRQQAAITELIMSMVSEGSSNEDSASEAQKSPGGGEPASDGGSTPPQPGSGGAGGAVVSRPRFGAGAKRDRMLEDGQELDAAADDRGEVQMIDQAASDCEDQGDRNE